MLADSEFVRGDADSFRKRLVIVFAILGVGNVAAWAWALADFAGQPALLGTAVLAYSLGLRHALDADHIAAIDNVTRRLLQDNKWPVAVGFFFALGHSAVLLLASLAVAFAASSLLEKLTAYRELGSLAGTLASTLFLVGIALANLAVLADVLRALRRARRGERVRDEDIDALLQQRGWLARVFQPLYRFITTSWHLFPLGFVFALGFETASEVSLFGLAAETSQKVSNSAILVFPALFAAGMTLIDTLDGVLMLSAYGWAYRNPMRKLLYNAAITAISVGLALVVAGIEALGLIAGHFRLQGVFWDGISGLNTNFGGLGFGIVVLFVVCWIVSIVVFHTNGYARRDGRA
jgi:nickel/cobalt transporter (NiCoT) family protein